MELIYKYLPPERLSFLQDGLLRMTQPSDLNDPLEFQTFCPRIDAILKKTEAKIAPCDVSAQTRFQGVSTGSGKREKIREYFKHLLSAADRDVGIVAFSKRWKNSAMWTHYAKRHEGFCVGFDRNHPLLQYSHLKMPGGSMHDVEYLPARREIDVVVQKDSLSFHDIVFQKSDDWIYEKEVRIAYALTDYDDKRNAPDESPTKLPLYLRRFQPEIIKEVMIGYNAKPDVCESVLEFAKAYQIPAFRMQISSSTSFAMEREPIS